MGEGGRFAIADVEKGVQCWRDVSATLRDDVGERIAVQIGQPDFKGVFDGVGGGAIKGEFIAKGQR